MGEEHHKRGHNKSGDDDREGGSDHRSDPEIAVTCDEAVSKQCELDKGGANVCPGQPFHSKRDHEPDTQHDIHDQCNQGNPDRRFHIARCMEDAGEIGDQ